jgi:hypothetical protein
MTTRDELVIKFTADVSGFNKRLAETQAMVKKLSEEVDKKTNSIEGSFKKVGGALSIAFGARELTQFTGRVINLADNVDKLSVRTGVSSSSLLKLNSSAIDAGISLDILANGINKLQLNLGKNNKSTRNALEFLGIDAESLKTQKPEQQFLTIVQGLEKVQDRATRAAVGTDIFGKSYKELELIVAEGSASIEENLKKNVPTDEQIKQLANFKDEWEKFTLGLQTNTIPVLTTILKILQGIGNTEDIKDKLLNSDFDNPADRDREIKKLQAFIAKNPNNGEARQELSNLMMYRAGEQLDKLPKSAQQPQKEYKSTTEVEKTTKAIEGQNKALDNRAEAIKRNAMPDYDFKKSLAEIDELYSKGKLTFEEMQSAQLSLQNTIADDLTDAINRPIRSFDDLREIALDVLQKIALQAIITGFQLDKISSGSKGAGGSLVSTIGKGLGSFFGGFFAEGGEPPLNKVSVVGEKGAELFVPKVAGTIVPNGANQIGGDSKGSVIFNQNLNFAVGVEGTVKAEIMKAIPSILRASQEGIVEANKRGGVMSLTLNNRS